MKHLILYTTTALILIVSSQISFAQCEPDRINCKDILQPGEICPMILPDGIVNTPYNVVFTIIPPSVFNSIIDTLEIAKIVINSVGNLPPGLSYQANSDTFFVDTAYCILVNGNPTLAGTFHLAITVTPYVYFNILGNKVLIESKPVVDDTSLTITIRDPVGIDEFQGKEFSILEASPNPFRNSTLIGFFTRNQNPYELRIYNLLGQLVYNEMLFGVPGKNYFSFTGTTLQAGTYLYNLSGNNKSVAKKLIKLN
jgi:hypothetical protein